eukprot:g32924.t1
MDDRRLLDEGEVIQIPKGSSDQREAFNCVRIRMTGPTTSYTWHLMVSWFEGHDHYGRYDLQTFYLLAKTLSLEQLRGEAPIVPSPIQSVIPAVSDSARARSAVVLVSEAELIEEDQTGPFGLYCSDQEIEDLIAQSRSERRPSTQAEVTRWSSDVVPLDLEAFRTRVNRREECIYCDDAALQRGLARTPPSRKSEFHEAQPPLRRLVNARGREPWKECKVQAAWHECQEAHAGQTLLPNFTGHGMRARSRVGRRELLEDELEEKRPPSGPRFTSKPRDFVFLSTSADVRVVAQAGQVEFLCDSSLLFRASPFFVAALREDCWLEAGGVSLHC